MVLFGVKNRYSTRSNLLQVIINYDQCGGSYEVFVEFVLGSTTVSTTCVIVNESGTADTDDFCSVDALA